MVMLFKVKPAFTIVELLIVIIVIGILAAVILIGYKGVTNAAYDATAQSNLRALSDEINRFKIENSDSLPTTATISSLNLSMIDKDSLTVLFTNGTTNYVLDYCHPSDQPGDYELVVRSKSGTIYANGTKFTGATAASTATSSSSYCSLAHLTIPSTNTVDRTLLNYDTLGAS